MMGRGKSWVVGRCVLLALILLVPACSSGFLYNRLNVVIPWYVEDYVDLNRSQRNEFDQNLAPILDWHRQVELPVYTAFIADVEKQLDETISTDQVRRWIDFALKAASRVTERAQPLLLGLAADLADEQFREYLDRMESNQEELEEDNLERDEEEYNQENFEQLRESLQDWMGRLDKDQQAVLRAAVLRLQRYDDHWLADRRQWLREMEKLLANKSGNWLASLALMLEERADPSRRSYKAASEHNQHVIAGVVSDVINSRTARQDKHLRRELEKWRKRFEGLQSQD